MKLDFIPLDKLSVDPANMRAKGRDPDVSDILPSVRKRGVLQSLIVRPDAEEGRFRISAGRRRFTAASIVAREGGPARPLPCGILEEGDDADAIEASMIENLARLARRAPLDVDVALEIEGEGEQADQGHDQAELPGLRDRQGVGGGQHEAGPGGHVGQLDHDEVEVAEALAGDHQAVHPPSTIRTWPVT